MATASSRDTLLAAPTGARPAVLWEFARPFTLLAPAVGMVSGSLTALGAVTPDAGRWASSWGAEPLESAARIAAGALMAALLNAYSNGLNQLCDVAIDRINKPTRPLCDGRLAPHVARAATAAFLVAALGVAALLGLQTFLLALGAAAATTAYSAEPLRLKRHGLWANAVVALARGLLLKVCGWSVVKTVAVPEPWWIGLVFALFLLGATSTKDFADMKGDAADGCRTLPLRWGVRRAAWLISPSFVVPFLALAAGARLDLFTGSRAVLEGLGLGLAVWGVWVVRGIVRAADALAATENHPSWHSMYRMMLVLQVGFAVAYLVQP